MMTFTVTAYFDPGAKLMVDKIQKTEEEWRALMSPEQFYVTRQKGTEQPFSGIYNDSKKAGVYHCSCCGQALFDSDDKFDSGTGWPSYTRPVSEAAVATEEDRAMGMARTEALCSACDAHLGHVFPDGPAPTGLRYCMNSLSLKLKERD